MEQGDLVRVWSPAGFAYAYQRVDETMVKSPNLKAGTLAMYLGPNDKEAAYFNQPMVDVTVGDALYTIDKRFLEVILV